MNQPQICVVAPDFTIGGGFYIIQDFIYALKSNEWDVCIATPSGDQHRANRRYGCKLKSCGSFNARNHKIFDAIVFTWWESIFWACHIKTKRIVWLSQSLEDYFLPKNNYSERVDALTPYMLRGIETIAISPWIQAKLETRFGIESTLIENSLSSASLDWDKYESVRDWMSKTTMESLSIIVEGSNAPYKNLEESIEVVDALGPSSKTLVFSGSGVQQGFLDELTEKGWNVLTNLSREHVIEQLKAHDILIRTSLLDSFGLSPLEMMRTGGLVMVKHYQGAPGLCIHRTNALLWSNKDDLTQLFSENEESSGSLFERIATSGLDHAKARMNSHIERYQDFMKQLLLRPYEQSLVAAVQLLSACRSISFKQYENVPEATSSAYYKTGSSELIQVFKKPTRYRIIDFIWFEMFKKWTPKPVKKSLNVLRRRITT